MNNTHGYKTVVSSILNVQRTPEHYSWTARILWRFSVCWLPVNMAVPSRWCPTVVPFSSQAVVLEHARHHADQTVSWGVESDAP